MNKQELYKKILEDHSELKIWKKLDNGCHIGTLGFSENNIYILMALLKSFEEQYSESIDYTAAKEELELYATHGKLFIYFNEQGIPISMNGCVFNYDNATVDFVKDDNTQPTSIYFYGLSTLKQFRGQGACKELINFAIEFAQSNGFDLVYARTDLTNSNSEWIMANAGLEVCTEEGQIIAEWVDVSENIGDYRLHMWKPLSEGIKLHSKGNALFAANDATRDIIPTQDISNKLKKELV